MKVAGTDNTGYMPIHRKCLVKLNTKKVYVPFGTEKLEWLGYPTVKKF